MSNRTLRMWVPGPDVMSWAVRVRERAVQRALANANETRPLECDWQSIARSFLDDGERLTAIQAIQDYRRFPPHAFLARLDDELIKLASLSGRQIDILNNVLIEFFGWQDKENR